jgi:DNA mismatch endonuclease (patch repair protein)
MDRLTTQRRSENMRRIQSKGMKPEMAVRSLIHSLGFRYRLHRSDLPGKPDLVFGPRRKVIFVHGCFWHGHEDPNCIDGLRKPKSNLEYWLPKLARNKERDTAAEAALIGQGWTVLTIWECDIRNISKLCEKIRQFLS